SWPSEGPYARFIYAYSLPNFDEWSNFSPADIAKYAKTKVVQLHPEKLKHTMPKSP
ncbi:4571_t:CDS:1, partial [Dentiscutata heterogama]